ncbi:MAG: alkaline phosphatase family protein [Deltaproteobacteria bacterium]|nr:alkaline phosphatase family protein [Deltaproteobacteria bacterium]
MPDRRRLLLVQIDGLSGRRLKAAMAAGILPSASELCKGPAREIARATVVPPSTPAFHSALLYGRQNVVHGYTWFDRQAGIIRRFDVPDDVAQVEAQLRQKSRRPPLLSVRGSVSYFLTFLGGTARALFTFATGILPSRWWRTRLLFTAAIRAVFVAPLELLSGLIDLARFARRERTLRFEWNWLLMRVLYASLWEELATISAIADLREGSPIVVLNFVAYDEAAHRRGPDDPVAMAQLERIDRHVARLVKAARQHGFDVVLMSDHGQAAAIPFSRIQGCSLAALVLTACAPRLPSEHASHLAGRLDFHLVRASRVRKWPSPIGPFLEKRARVRADRLADCLVRDFGVPARDVAVVTGGSITHVYLGRDPGGMPLEEIEARYPRLIPSLMASQGVGLVVSRRGAGGPTMFFRGARIPLSDRDSLACLPPCQETDPDLLRLVISRVVSSQSAGDLVVYGAFAQAGAVTFDEELGSHGGVHPDELDVFVIQPDGLPLPGGALDPALLSAVLREVYAA